MINVGSSAGVKAGDTLAVQRAGRKITDPATGKVLRQVEDAIGEMTVTEVIAARRWESSAARASRRSAIW